MPLPKNNEPPMVVVLKRKSIRNFPDGQRVALYHNDALGIDVAFPYNTNSGNLKSPVTLQPGQKVVKIEDDKKKKTVKESYEGDVHEVGSRVKIHSPNDWDWHGRTGIVKGHADWYQGKPHLYHVQLENGSHINLTHKEVMKEEVEPIDEKLKQPTTFRSFGDWYENAAQKGGEGTHFKVHDAGNKTSAFKEGKKLGTFDHAKTHGDLAESVMHHINRIAASGKEDAIIFRNGASARVHPTTAKMVMDIHGKVNSGNQKKLSDMANASPRGFEKVARFAMEHAKQQEAEKAKK